MVVESVDVGLLKSRQSLVLLEDGSELTLPNVAFSGSAKCHGVLKLVAVKHGDFGLASPTPEQLHTRQPAPTRTESAQ